MPRVPPTPPVTISIHALREEGDDGSAEVSSQFSEFLSTPSARRATGNDTDYKRWAKISIHALREEGDISSRQFVTFWCYFYPRPPRGGRHITAQFEALFKTFLSTPSARRATFTSCLPSPLKNISIHALREEGDICHVQIQMFL